MKLLLLGATGLVGKNVLAQALAVAAVSGVVAPTRRPLAAHPKLVNPVSDRLQSLVADELFGGVGGVVCALGTTIRKAGSREAFREVDYALPLLFAQSAREYGVARFALVSASVASPRSGVFYARIKGEVERDVQLIGFPSLTILRPSLIGGEREERRFGEAVALQVMRTLAPILPKRFRVNPASAIAAASLQAVLAGEPGVHVRPAASLTGA